MSSDEGEGKPCTSKDETKPGTSSEGERGGEHLSDVGKPCTSKDETKPGTSSEGERGGEHLSDEESGLSTIHHFVARKFGLLKLGDKHKEEVKVLDDVSLDGIATYIKEGKAKKIITMAGAGISTSSGIPDFRSPGSGLYHNLQKYNLPDPQAIFELKFFCKNPQPFFTLAKELYPGSFKPTICHYFIRLLHEKGLLYRHYTQNIDTLERVAGIPGSKLVEAHGTFYTSHCLSCKKEYTLEWMKERIFGDIIPTCENCNAVVKPDIVFFGESMPSRYLDNYEKDFKCSDLLIIMGSSLTVQPFASLVDRVPEKCPRLLLNRVKTGHRGGFMTFFGLDGGFDFDSETNSRDVMWLGDCDDGCLLLAEKLGWGDELKQIVQTEHEKISKEGATGCSPLKLPKEQEKKEQKNTKA